MRIISQDGMSDVPYGKERLFIVGVQYIMNGNRGYEYHITTNKKDAQKNSLGEYTKERALEVMKEIRKSYIGDSQKVLINEDTFDVKVFPKIHYFYMPKE